MNLEARLAAIESDLLAIKQRLGLPQSAADPLLPAAAAAPSLDAIPAAAIPNPPAPSLPPPPMLGRAPGALPPVYSGPGAEPPPIIRGPSKEVIFGGYWVTRIGAVLVLLAAIFLAAYLSIYSNPTVRISELIGAAWAALGVAYWQQERRNLRFALVLHSLGDALVFFTAFAAYAFESTQVIHSITGAIAVQTLAGAAVCAHALHRRSERSATFALVLLTWVAGFSLNYQQSETTLGYVAAIAAMGAVLRFGLGWNLPLAYAAIASPALATVLADQIPGLRLEVQVTLAVLPILATLPFTLGRGPLDSRDRTVCVLAFAANLAAALFVRYGLGYPVLPYPHQLLVESGSFGLIALLFALRSSEALTVRAGLASQAAFAGSISFALYLYAEYGDRHWAGLAILGVGAAAAFVLRKRHRWVSGYAHVSFCVLAQIWVMGLSPVYVRFGSELYWYGIGGVAVSGLLLELALGENTTASGFIVIGIIALCALGYFAESLADPATAIVTLLALGAAAIAITRRFAALSGWAFAALVVAHLAVFMAKIGPAEAWLVSLVLIAATDAVVLSVTKPFRSPAISALPLVVTLCMLGTLYYGLAHARLEWSATFAWVPLAAGTFVLGFVLHNPSYRVAALAAFGVCLIRLFANDLNSAFTRILAFFLLGLILLGIGYLYSRLNRSHRLASDKAA